MGDELSAVKKELERINQGKEREKGVSQQQLSLFKALTKDISVPTIGLVTKLNCETKRTDHRDIEHSLCCRFLV